MIPCLKERGECDPCCLRKERGGGEGGGGGAHLKDGHIKGTTTKVKDQDGLIRLLLKAVCQGGCGGLVHNPQHVQACDASSILGRLTLGVVEVGWDCDDGLLNLPCMQTVASASAINLEDFPFDVRD